jgi:hypothetical protein
MRGVCCSQVPAITEFISSIPQATRNFNFRDRSEYRGSHAD